MNTPLWMLVVIAVIGLAAYVLLSCLKVNVPGAAVSLLFNITYKGQTLERVTKMQIADDEKFTASIAPVDAKGNTAQVEPGSVQWTGPAFVTITPAADGLSAEIVAAGLGSGQVIVTADADLGSGVATITSQPLQIDVVAGQAVGLSINTTAPVKQ